MPWGNDSNVANYMFLMQVEDSRISEYNEAILVRITLAGSGLSIIGALLSVFLICYVPIRSDGLFAVGNMCSALIGAQLAFAGAENAFPTKMMCKISTAILHYLFLAVHFWCLAFSLHLFFKMQHILQGNRWKRRCILVTTGWVIPIAIVATAAVLTGDKYGGERLCWLSAHNKSRWAFVGPVCAISVVNALVIMVMVSMQYFHDLKREVTIPGRIRNAVGTVISLLPVSSLPWLLGLASIHNTAMQYLFVLFNSSQGVFIFCLHMLFSTQIRSLLRVRLIKSDGNKEEIQLSKTGSTGDTKSSDIHVFGCGKPKRG